MQAGLPETLADLFNADRRSRRVGGPQLASTEREQLKAALKSKGRIALADIEKEMGNAYRRALNVKLIDIFAGAWSAVTQVAELGDTTNYPSGEKHFVPLANHRITSDHRPKVEVLVDGMPLVSLTLNVNLQAQFEAAVLEVEGGHIHAIKPGNCLAMASVSCRGVPIASTSSRRLALPAEIELQPPFAIRAFGGVASPPRSEPILTLSGRDEKGRVVEFRVAPTSEDTENTWVIGRRAGRVDFVISHRLVSNEHALIHFSGAKGLEICDLDSSNGTVLDGKPIGRQYVSLAEARKVAFGGFEMEVQRG
jgi:hypothetical protein